MWRLKNILLGSKTFLFVLSVALEKWIAFWYDYVVRSLVVKYILFGVALQSS